MNLSSNNEDFCKSIYANHIFSQFNNYPKFREYAIKKGFYQSKKYNTSMFSYNYLKQNNPEFLSENETNIIKNTPRYNCIIM